jgi:hypothetical protein
MDPLVKYIEEEHKKGFSDDLIRQKLLQTGYTPQEIQYAYHDYEVKQHYHKFIDKIVEQEAKHKWIFLVLCIVFVILSTAFIAIAIKTVDWTGTFSSIFPSEPEIPAEPTTEHDCSVFTHREKERCLLKVAALYDDISFCANLTSKVMKYECKTSVWNKNYCNFLILTDQGTAGC